MTLSWQCTPFAELSPAELHAGLQLRQRVFVVEQKCAYLDADDIDAECLHLFGWEAADRQRLVACCRLVPPGVKYAEASIGRVASHPDVRGTGAGKELVRIAIEEVEAAGWGRAIRIAAQMYLENFYEGFGFRRVSEPYLEDDIWHVDMLRD